MALIQCPECGREISDKAKKCIHCGKVFIEEQIEKEEIICNECGMILLETDEVCPNCGCPVERKADKEESKPQQVEVASIKMTKKTQKIIIGIVIALVLCVGGGIGYKVYSDSKAEQIYREAYNEYITNLERAQMLMLSGGSDAESLCNLALRVWGNSIYEKSDAETDKYTKPRGFFHGDFNDALANLYADSSTMTTVSNIEINKTSVKDLMKKLQNPPEELEKCYDTVSELYESYNMLTDLAVSPSGNYSSFSSNKNDAVSDFMSIYEKLDNQIPEKLDDK